MLQPIYVLEHPEYDQHVFFHLESEAEEVRDLLNRDERCSQIPDDSDTESTDSDNSGESEERGRWKILTIYPCLFFDAECIDENYDNQRQFNRACPRFSKFRNALLAREATMQKHILKSLENDKDKAGQIKLHKKTLERIERFQKDCMSTSS